MASEIMEESHVPPPMTSRSTGIPRLSRLPVARSSVGKSLLPKPSTDTLRTHSTPNPQSASLGSTSTRPFKTPHATSSSSKPRPAVASRITGHATTRSILSSNASKQRVPSTSVFGSTSDASRRLQSTSTTSSRHVSRVESEISTTEGANSSRRPRLSLAERTMESIAKVPPSPINRRRRSSFFQQQSPMPNSRPPSALAQDRSVADHDVVPVPTIRPEVLQRHMRAPATTVTRNVRTPARTNIASRTLPASARPEPKVHGTTRNLSPTKTTRPSAKSTGSKPTRPALAGLFHPPNAHGDTAQDDKSPKAVAAAKSSSALREQIRAARAAKRDVTARPTADVVASNRQLKGFDLDHDPFNQQPKDEKAAFRCKIDTARSEGRLNISGLGLKELPEDVIKMYDFEHNKKHSNIAWNETVDLIKLIAADNEIESIPDHVFPDVDMRDASHEDDSTTPQFGGIQLLDFRGNLLFDLPVGLRRLENLTSLNLSRNRLMNDSLDTIFQITSLKELRVSDNALTGELATSIANLSQLEVLEVQNNKLSSLPPEMSALVHLQSLNVSSNQMTSLPMDAIGALPLMSLLATKNHLSGSVFICDQSMSRLQTLDLSVNSLTSFATGTVHLPRLQELNMSFNRIAELPDVSSWSSLISLFAEDNKLSQIPEGFTKLQTLRVADFTGNNFSKLDSRIGLMDRLETFKVAANPIRERKFLTMDTAGLKRDLRARLGLDQPGHELD